MWINKRGYMQEGTIPWDPLTAHRNEGPLVKVYVLLMLIVFIVAVVRLIRIWIGAPPFRLSKRAKDPKYLRLLESLRNSFCDWIGFTLLCGGFVVGSGVYSWSNRVLEINAVNDLTLVLIIQDLAPLLNLCLFVSLFLFLVRWHLHNRIARLKVSLSTDQQS